MAAGGDDILIVGAGPSGLAAALFLSHRGIVPRIVEQSTEPSRHSKALGVNPRTLQLLAGTGVDERLIRRMPWLVPPLAGLFGRRVIAPWALGLDHEVEL